jgi:hypothetical protein
MGHSGTPSSHSRFVLAGLACVFCFYIFLRLVIILEPRVRGSNGRGAEIVNWGVVVVAGALFFAGISLLTWGCLRHLPSRSKAKLSGQTSRCTGVWDHQFDG